MCLYFIFCGLVLIWIPERDDDIKGTTAGISVTATAIFGVIFMIAGSAIGCVSIGLFTMSVEAKTDRVKESN